MAASRYDNMLSNLGYEKLSQKVEALFYAWEKTDRIWMMPKDEWDWVKQALSLDEDTVIALDKSYHIIKNDESLCEMLSFMQYVYMIGAHVSEWLMQQPPHIKHDKLHSDTFQLMAVLSLIPLAKKDHQRRHIDETHMQFNLKHLKGYIKLIDPEHHIYGIHMYGWTLYLASFGLIHLSSLHFMHHSYTDPFYFYQHRTTKKVIAVVKEGVQVRKDGQLNGVNGYHDLWFVSTFEQTNTSVKGYAVHPSGFITNQIVDLDLKVYDLVLQPGDVVIDFHIPSKSDYRVETFHQTLQEGKAFYEKHYHEYHYKGFWCVSWLYSPQLNDIIEDQQSRILQVAHQGYILPATPGAGSLYTFVFGTEQPDFETLEAKTSLQRAVKAYVLNQKTINAGCFIYLMEHLDRFGEKPYQTLALRHKDLQIKNEE